jgi:hypothetical protein
MTTTSTIPNNPSTLRLRFLSSISTAGIPLFAASTKTSSSLWSSTPLSSQTTTSLSSSSSLSPRELLDSPIFGKVGRIRMINEIFDQEEEQPQSNDQNDQSFVGAMGVPTFATLVAPSSTTSLSSTTRYCDHHDNDDQYPRDSSSSSTHSTHSTHHPTIHHPKRGLEGALHQHGPAFVVDQVLSPSTCQQIIHDAETLGFGNFDCGRNHHAALQILVDPKLADTVAQVLAPHIDVHAVEALRKEMIMKIMKMNIPIDTASTSTTVNMTPEEDVRLIFQGLNRRWRIYRYHSSGNETFAPHIDAGFPPSSLSDDQTTLIWDSSEGSDQEMVSRLTVLIYLNDDFVGGETNFYRPLSMQRRPNSDQLPPLIASVKPMVGSVLLFPQAVGEDAVDYARQAWPLHEGSPVVSGRPKYVIRSDAIFVTQKQKLLLDNNDDLFRYDHLVRNAFLPSNKSTVFQREFVSHISSLYNPHMGVENMGPFLYTFLRMTKKKKIVEIGAGYTSLWILKALQDNDEELAQIIKLQQANQCKLLDIEWTVDEIELRKIGKEPARLLCLDNCEHQKETATGAGAVAKSLGLDSYLEFRKGDAFVLDLGNETVDALWCDFGVGSRMAEFMSLAWPCIRPGGFFLCHSTITNQNTRKWLNAIRQRQPKEITGIKPDEYVELSILEPHKRYQNSVSIIQKRKSNHGEYYFEEPVYSQNA